VWGKGPLDAPPGGEHRGSIAARYAAGLRILLGRREETILLVAHSLTLAYLRDGAAGRAPRSRTDLVAYAEALRLDREQVERAAEVLEAWAAAPAFEAH
jgi:broad specificity phosphatase PhoE